MNEPPTTNESLEEIDLTDRHIGDYRLLRRLGRGGMADVYLAEQKSLKRNVALKVLKAELAKDASYVKRFEREAQAAAALVQANIVQIYEVGRDKDCYYIAQEYVRGRNLKQYLDRHGAVEPVMAVNVLRQSALAIQKAHELGVIHRDIKPENIMLSTKGEVKITDFGLARINNSEAEQALTQIGVTMGTPLYMSPEQIGGLSLDHRSDIYSLGVTAYHMLAGEPPFNGDTALAIAIQHVNEAPKDLAVLRPDVPPALIKIVNKMMAKKPADRPADPKQLLKELRAIKIDVDEDWEMIVEKLSVTELANASAASTSFSQAQLAATRQLQQVMRGNVRSWWRSKGLWLTVTLSGVLGLGAGVYSANLTPPVSLLNVKDIANERIPKQENIVTQYHMAVLAPMDQHEVMLKKVLEYFPVDEAKDKNLTAHYHRNTYARLAEWYVVNSRWKEAEELFTKLANSDGLAESFQVMGYAGQAIAYFNMPASEFDGGSDEQNERIGYSILNVAGRESMLNPMIAQLYEEVLEGNAQLEELGRELFRPHSPELYQQNDAN